MADPNFDAPVTNPFGLSDVGLQVRPTFVDIDGDGDLDAFVGSSFGETFFFLNNGTASAPSFAAAAANPFNLTDIGSGAAPTFADIDDDGDLDAFIGDFFGNTRYFQNTGSASAPSFAAPALNQFGLADVGYLSVPVFVDIDGDGDLDAFIGEYEDGDIHFFRNDGTAAAPSFVSASNFGLDIGGPSASLAFADIEGDGDLDLFVGVYNGNTDFFRNTGSASAPSFDAPVSVPFGLADAGSRASPTLADIDGDGDLDAFIGNTDGDILFFLNAPPGVTITPSGGSNAVTEGGATDTYTVVLNSEPTDDVVITLNTTNGQVTVNSATLTFTSANWDDAQTVTITAVNDTVGEGAHAGVILHSVESDDPAYDGLVLAPVRVDVADNDLVQVDPIFAEPVANPFGLTNLGGHATPTFADIDGDGDLDAFIGQHYGETGFFLNNGSASAPGFASPVSSPFGLTDVGLIAQPTFGDIDLDGDLDAFVGGFDGNISFFRNTGSASAPSFASEANFGLTNVGSFASPTLADIDGDGDLDAFVGAYDGNTRFFENTGSASAPSFSAAVANPFGLTDIGYGASPTFADIDGDGDLDAFVGINLGNTFFYRNTGDASAPSFSLEVSAFGTDVGQYASPTFADIDGDGDLDAFVGNVDGNILSSSNNGHAPVVTSGATGGSVAENGLAGSTLVYTATASDADAGTTTFTYSLTGTDAGLFGIDSVSGAVTFLSTADFETQSSYSFDVVASDGDRTGSEAVTVSVTNIVETGTAGAETLVGGAGANTLNGLAGDDSIVGGTGGDSLLGGLGNDTARGGDGQDTIVGGLGSDSLLGESSADRLDGGAGDDSLDGGTGNDQMIGGTGNDQMAGGTDDDSIDGGQGNDVIDGGTGSDTLLGAVGDDSLDGGYESVSNYLDGGLGNDTLRGGSEADTLIGNGGNDLVTAYEGNDFVDAAAGNDVVYADTGNNTVLAGAGNDQVTSDGGDDSISGGADNDQIASGSGNDTISGEQGLDTIAAGDGEDSILAGLGNDSVDGGDGNDFVSGGAGNDSLLGGADGGNDTLVGEAGNDSMVGGDGADSMTDGAGNDTLLGGAGDDIMDGGVGNDSLDGGTGNDAMTGGAGTDNLTGGSGHDTLLGGAANDTLDGAGGDDSMDGGIGADQLSSGNGADHMAGGDGLDNLNGGAGNDTMSGNAGADMVVGMDGDDSLEGNLGVDTLVGGAGDDIMSGGGGKDLFVYEATSLDSGDVAEAAHDTLSGAGDVISMSGLLDELMLGGVALSALTTNTLVGGALDANNNVAFSGGVLQIDLDNDDTFNAAEDFQITLTGVTTVTYTAATDLFTLT